MKPQELEIKDFTYELPDERIARYPLPERDLSKLLVYNKGVITEDIYRHIAQYLPEKSMLFFNHTKVIPARLFFENTKGAAIEILCLEPAGAMDMHSAMHQKGSALWQCMIGRASKWKEKALELTGEGFKLSAEIADRNKDAFIVQFSWEPAQLTFAEVLDKAGNMPIPPYLKREPEELDDERYQTVYAKHRGSVAAPTAGLHFTDRVFDALRGRHISTEYLTLHVGAGTFKPVKSATIGEHEMHAEVTEITVETLEHLLHRLKEKEQGGGVAPIVAVGTTAMRSLESLYWLGLKVLGNPQIMPDGLKISQWEPYGRVQDIAPYAAVLALVNWLRKNNLQQLDFKTQIMIAPGYRLKIADALITNFHQPNSTLLLLIAALLGEDWKKVYNYALAHNFRFLSYGDGSLLMF